MLSARRYAISTALCYQRGRNLRGALMKPSGEEQQGDRTLLHRPPSAASISNSNKVVFRPKMKFPGSSSGLRSTGHISTNPRGSQGSLRTS
ncbi:unnamed protein product [Arctogadus glacialis]